MLDEFRHRAGAGGGAHKQSRTTAKPARVPQVFVIGANASTLAVVNSLKGDPIQAQLVPLAWTPLGIAVGEGRKGVGIAIDGLYDWIDHAFPAEDDRAFVASIRDLELLARVEWDSAFPEKLDERSILNVEDLPDDMLEALAQPQVALVQCGACRRLCVRDDFVWKEKQLCAWDYHAQVFGKRGPWREGLYEDRHFETLPSCAYVVPELLSELGVQALLTVGATAEPATKALVNTLLESDPRGPHIAVKTGNGVVVLRET